MLHNFSDITQNKLWTPYFPNQKFNIDSLKCTFSLTGVAHSLRNVFISHRSLPIDQYVLINHHQCIRDYHTICKSVCAAHKHKHRACGEFRMFCCFCPDSWWPKHNNDMPHNAGGRADGRALWQTTHMAGAVLCGRHRLAGVHIVMFASG